MSKIKLGLIGLGPHAQRIYLPLIKQHTDTLELVLIADLNEKAKQVESICQSESLAAHRYYVGKDSVVNLSPWDRDNLNVLKAELGLQAIIISSSPESHYTYADWGIAHRLHVLMDKPVTMTYHASTNPESADAIYAQFQQLKSRHLSIPEHERPVFMIQSQRRYHPAYQKIVSAITSCREQTNALANYIYIHHADGQFRLLDELKTIRYHGYQDGIGKCAHSGYHFFDMISQMIKASGLDTQNDATLTLDSIFSRPADLVKQVDFKQVDKLMQAPSPAHSTTQLPKGEVDAHVRMVIKSGTAVVSTIALCLMHNSFSQRTWANPNADLYKKNGRTRHETVIVHQGPFQTIHYHSYQGTALFAGNLGGKPGDEDHAMVNIYRNGLLEGPAIESYAPQFTTTELHGYSRGHQEESRAVCFREFIDQVQGKPSQNKSPLTDHTLTNRLLAAAYKSAAQAYRGRDPSVVLRLHRANA